MLTYKTYSVFTYSHMRQIHIYIDQIHKWVRFTYESESHIGQIPIWDRFTFELDLHKRHIDMCDSFTYESNSHSICRIQMLATLSQETNSLITQIHNWVKFTDSFTNSQKDRFIFEMDSHYIFRFAHMIWDKNMCLIHLLIWFKYESDSCYETYSYT